MIRRRFTEILLYGAGPLAIFATAPILARGLGPEGRGELGVAQSVASFALALGAIGQAEVLLADRREGRGSLRVSGRIALCGGVFASIAGAFALLALEVDPLVALAALVLIPLLSQSQLWRSIAIANKRLGVPAMNNAVGAGLRVALLLGLVGASLVSTASAMFALQLSLAVAAVLTLGAFSRRNDLLEQKQPGFTTYAAYIRRGLPLIAFSLLTSVTLRSDVVALQIYSDPAGVGVYAAASSLSMAVLSVSGAFKSRAQAASFSPEPQKAVRREVLIVMGFGALGATGAIILAPWIVAALLGPGFESAVPLLRVLAISCVGLLVLDTVHGLLAALGQRRMMVLVGAGGAVVRLGTLVAFVPGLGPMGAAISTAISYTVACVLGWIIVERSLS